MAIMWNFVNIVIGLPVYEYFLRRAGFEIPPLWQHDDERDNSSQEL
jgi:hypothetical protein